MNRPAVASWATHGAVSAPEVVIVGSGFGGSVMAARLAERGMRVLVFERGPWWGPGGEQRAVAERRRYPRGVVGARKLLRGVRWSRGRGARELRLHTDGLIDIDVFRHLLVFTSSGVGGGSHIYTNVNMQPDAEYFDGFPDEITASEMAPYYDAVRDMQRPMRAPVLPGKTVTFTRAVKAAGLPEAELMELAVAFGESPTAQTTVVNAAGVQQPTSTYSGTDIVGCEDGSKTTLDRTYLPVAQRNGAEIRALSEVTAIGRGARGYRVRWREHTSDRDHELETPRLVLAAGTLATLRLLFAARDLDRSLPALPRTLGHGFTSNADCLNVVYGSPLLEDSGYGPAFTAATLVRVDGRFHHTVGEVGLPVNALPLPRPIRERLKHSSVLFGMGRDAGGGRVWHDGRGLCTDTDRSIDPATFDAIEQTARRIAQGYLARRTFYSLPSGAGARGLMTVHPLGGAAVAAGPDRGVIDHTGQVFGHPGLYVTDSAFYPCAPGLPPSMTVAAFAERAASVFDERQTATSRGPDKTT